jgi:hypothetical protein
MLITFAEVQVFINTIDRGRHGDRGVAINEIGKVAYLMGGRQA